MGVLPPVLVQGWLIHTYKQRKSSHWLQSSGERPLPTHSACWPRHLRTHPPSRNDWFLLGFGAAERNQQVQEEALLEKERVSEQWVGSSGVCNVLHGEGAGGGTCKMVQQLAGPLGMAAVASPAQALL